MPNLREVIEEWRGRLDSAVAANKKLRDEMTAIIARPEVAAMTTARATRAIIETKRIDGRPAHRLAGSPEGAWKIARSEIDAMLDRVQAETGAKRSEILCAADIDSARASRCRHGTQPLLDQWVLRLSDFSGIPAAELRQVACIEPAIYPHLRARRVP